MSTNDLDAVFSHVAVLQDVAGVLAEELRLARPNNHGIDYSDLPGAEQLLRAQHERDVVGVIKALVECGLALDTDKFLSLCRDKITYELEPRSK